MLRQVQEYKQQKEREEGKRNLVEEDAAKAEERERVDKLISQVTVACNQFDQMKAQQSNNVAVSA